MDYVGRTVFDYRLTRLLGKGSFARVYLGEHVQTKAQVAIKIFNDESNYYQIRDEAARQARLPGHPHIVEVFPVNSDQQGKPNYVGRDHYQRLFLILQYAPNGSLRGVMQPDRPLPLSDVVAYVDQVAAALQAIHDAGMIHRDVKPTNILFGERNQLLLTDFGIARDVLPGGFHHTLNIAGTWGYMGPEQVKQNPTARSDQYSLAVIAYELLTCRKPIEEKKDETLKSLMDRVIEEIPLHPIQWNPGIPPAVDAVIMRGLEKDQGDRFPSVMAFATALAEAAQGKIPLLITPAMLASAQEAAAAENTSPGSMSKTFPQGLTMGEGSTAGARVGLCVLSNEIYEVRWLSYNPLLAILTRERVPTTPLGTGQTGAPPGARQGPTSPQNQGTQATLKEPNATIHIWDPNQQRPFVSYPLNDGQLSPNGAFVARPVGNTVEVHDLLGQRLVVTYHGHTGDVKKIAWSPDTKYIASAGNDHTIQVWDAISGKLSDKFWSGVYQLHGAPVTAVAWSLMGERIASYDQQGIIQMWDAIFGAKVIDAPQRLRNLIFLEWQLCPNPRYILLATREEVRLWDTSDNTLLTPFSLDRPDHQLVRWSPGGQFLAARTGDNVVTVWSIEENAEPATGLKRVATCTCRSSVHALTWSPVGNILAIGEADRVEVWSPLAEVPIFAYEQHIKKVSALDWSPDGRLLASGGTEKQVHAWKASNFIPKGDPLPFDLFIQKVRYRARAIQRRLGKRRARTQLVLAGVDGMILPLIVSVFLPAIWLVLAPLLAYPALALVVYRLWRWRPGNTQPVLGSKLSFLFIIVLASLWASAAWTLGTALFTSRCFLFICALIGFLIGVRVHTRMLSTLNRQLRSE